MAKSNAMDLRQWQPTESQAKNVMDTKHLNTTARETQDTVDDDNSNKEYVTTSPGLGKLGAQGRE